MRIRPARAGDGEACARLWHDFGKALIDRGLPFRMPKSHGLPEYFERLIAGAGKATTVLVAEMHEELLGLAIAQLRPPGADAEFSLSPGAETVRALLEDLVVAEGQRGKGIGAQLLEAVEAWARREGATMLMLNSDPDGIVANFYLKNGYERGAALYVKDLR